MTDPRRSSQPSPSAGRPAGSTSERSLPAYDGQQSGFHEAFRSELQAIVNELPLGSGMHVLDLACGDGFYARRMAERLTAAGAVVGVDVNLAYLAEAGAEASRQSGRARIDF